MIKIKIKLKLKLFLYLIGLLCWLPTLNAQNTVGLIKIDKAATFEGYNLFYSHNQDDVILIDNCGEEVHRWVGNEDFRPGNSAYLTKEGNLLKCKRFFNPTIDSIWAGGGGQIVEMLDWDNNLIWSFELKNELQRLHHDIAPMPNGNVLMISWELKTLEESLQAGRNPDLLLQNKLWPDYILEYNPTLDSIVWEWHAWNHLIQDFDSSKDNFGVVSENMQLIDINYETKNGHPDWLHANAIDYNSELDQILLTVPHFDELWIIDHSTTTAEAKGHSGGNSGKGGDLLFRWGNPVAHGVDGAKQIHFAHDAHWVDDFVDETSPYFGKIALFNNRVGENYSTVNILQPDYDSVSKSYLRNDNLGFAPTTFDLTLTHPDTFPIFSSGLSSVQILPNDNFLILSGRVGRAFEIVPTTGKVVWEYVIPFKGGAPVAQGTELALNNNITFRLKRYPLDFSAFTNRDVSPKGYLELEPNTEFCNLSVSTNEVSFDENELLFYPNPVSDLLHIEVKNNKIKQLQLIDIHGRILKEVALKRAIIELDLSDMQAGIYWLKGDNGVVKKVVVN